MADASKKDETRAVLRGRRASHRRVARSRCRRRTRAETFEHFAEIARTAERGKFDLLFTADTYATFGADDVETWSRTTQASRLEPLTLLGGLSAITKNIGLVATMTSTYFEPYHVARFFASLDQISNGRAGWNLVTSLSASEACELQPRQPRLPCGTLRPRARIRPRRARPVGHLGRRSRCRRQGERSVLRQGQAAFPQSQGQAFLRARTADGAALGTGPSGDRAGRPVGRPVATLPPKPRK